jgi:hypothetical protein
MKYESTIVLRRIDDSMQDVTLYDYNLPTVVVVVVHHAQRPLR